MIKKISFTVSLLFALCTVALLTSGCGGKDEGGTPPADEKTPAATGSEGRPTPAQEAVKQQAIQQGEAMQAAKRAEETAQGGK